MAQVLDRIPSFGENFVNQFLGGANKGLSQGMQFAQQMALQKQKSHSLANETKQLEKIKTMEHGLGTIAEMRKLISSTGPSNWIQGLLPGETQKKRAEFESLGRSLIPLVSAGVPIRNQKEFEEYRKIITDPNAPQSKIEGALNGIQNILERSSGHSEEEPEMESSGKKMKFSADNPEHRKKAQQLHKTFKDKEKVREALSREFEF